MRRAYRVTVTAPVTFTIWATSAAKAKYEVHNFVQAYLEDISDVSIRGWRKYNFTVTAIKQRRAT